MIDLKKYSEIIIWGACLSPKEEGIKATSHGYAAEKLFTLLQANGYADKILFFVDSNTRIWGKYRFGKEIKSPEEIHKYPNALIIINSLSMQVIQNVMSQMKISNKCMIIPYYFYHGTLEEPYDNLKAKKQLLKYKKELLEL